jgi:hypothetical protein
MIIMSLRDGDLPSKQSPVARGDCLPYGYDVATCARNDIQGGALRELQSPSGMISASGVVTVGKNEKKNSACPQLMADWEPSYPSFWHRTLPYT